jgi:hypothetical protein
MGGSGGGGIPSDDYKKLEERAKQELKQASEGDISRHVFISFAYEDVDEVNLLRGQAKNEKTDLQFDDYSVKEAFDSTNADYIKRQIREKLDRTSVTLVYLSNKCANSEWVNWEIEESIRRGKRVIGLYKGDVPPTSVPRAFAENSCKSVKWNHEELTKAISEATNKRK